MVSIYKGPGPGPAEMRRNDCMRTIKRLLAAGLAVATLVSVPAFAAETDGLEHFQPVAAYSDGLFTDLDPNG